MSNTRAPIDAGDNIPVWVEVSISNDIDSNTTTSSKNASKFGKRDAAKVKELTRFELGHCSKEAFVAAEFMRRAQQSRQAAETAITTITKKKHYRNDSMQVRSGRGGDLDQLQITVTLESGERPFPFQKIFPANVQSLIASTWDLTGLTYMEEPNVICSLEHRYLSRDIYTNIASIVVAINPYQSLNVYSAESMMKYREKDARKKHGPHIFAVAEEAYLDLCRPFSKRRQESATNQSIIVCGESGSGKTESAKYLMRYLANRSHDLYNAKEDHQQEALIERQVLEANHILEAFGNANTLLNHNSSRFGKFTKLYFATPSVVEGGVGNVVGASTETYLLEKSRLVRQNRGERNFHVFYQILAGIQGAERDELQLNGRTPDQFYYVNQGEMFQVKGINDSDWFTRMVKAMEVMGIDASVRKNIFSVLAALLFLGNIVFEDDPSEPDTCKITESSRSALRSTADLFSLDVAVLEKRLTTCRIKLPGSWIEKRYAMRDAIDNRDAIAKSTYNGLFKWVVDRINQSLSKSDDLPWIGLLDVFGFEQFENNSFEQFCINFANEMLQQHFNNAILLSEQREYAKEAIIWTPMSVPDNQDTIDLVSKNVTGVLALLDSACKMKATTIESFVDSLFQQHPRHERLVRMDRGGRRHVEHGFTIVHYAGDVLYNADEFLLKNNDSTDPDTVTMMQSSKSNVLKGIFAKSDDEVSMPGGRGKRTVQSKFSSVSRTFTTQLQVLLKTLSATESFFIRCVKPNTEFASWVFDSVYVRPQLRCGGLVEAVRMLKVGYPTRVAFDEVYKQYSPLLNPIPSYPLNRRDFTQAVLYLFGLRRSEYQLGLSKVFFRAGKRAMLETVMNRDEKLSPQDMSMLIGFMYVALLQSWCLLTNNRHRCRKKWQRTIGTVKGACGIWRQILAVRAVAAFRKGVRIAVAYNRSLGRCLGRVRTYIAVRALQASMRAYKERTSTLEALHREKLERQREEMRQKALAEKEAAENEARIAREERNARDQMLRQATVDKQRQGELGAPTSMSSSSRPISGVIGATSVLPESHVRVETKTIEVSSNADQAKIEALEAENSRLKEQYKNALSEIERLKEVVDQLDDINNRLVEDLMNELVLRTQLSDEVAFGSRAPPVIEAHHPQTVRDEAQAMVRSVRGNSPAKPTHTTQNQTAGRANRIASIGAQTRQADIDAIDAEIAAELGEHALVQAPVSRMQAHLPRVSMSTRLSNARARNRRDSECSVM